jgi:DNA-binding IclR family transcriptional regulator
MPLTRYTSHTVMDPAKLVEALDRIRRTRVGIDNGEFIDGVVCVSVPVITQSGQVVGAIAVSAPQARVNLDQAMTFVPIMHEAAARLSATFQFGSGAE